MKKQLLGLLLGLLLFVPVIDYRAVQTVFEPGHPKPIGVLVGGLSFMNDGFGGYMAVFIQW